jgi:hypothetical protein
VFDQRLPMYNMLMECCRHCFSKVPIIDEFLLMAGECQQLAHQRGRTNTSGICADCARQFVGRRNAMRKKYEPPVVHDIDQYVPPLIPGCTCLKFSCLIF